MPVVPSGFEQTADGRFAEPSGGKRAALNAVRGRPNLGSFEPHGRLREVDGFPLSPERCPQRIRFEARGVDALSADLSAVVSLRVGDQRLEGYVGGHVLLCVAGAHGQRQQVADEEECDSVHDHAPFQPTVCVFLHSVDAGGSAGVPSVPQSPGDFDRQLILAVVEL